ncbi:MAG: formylglycine-generating enzyme family protein [Verrucomicrobia bacterium]|nr:formylglycine-generating enzyme family protein [Verrucomicrobiota bacterium]
MTRSARRSFLQRGLGWVALGARAPRRLWAAGGLAFDPAQHLIPAPADPADWPSFRQRLQEWRRTARQQLEYDDALYRRPDFGWVPRTFACHFVMLNDERFYEWRRGRSTVQSYLDLAQREFGGCDALVLWQAYPRIGLDDRNQFDFYRDQPGGLPGLRTVAAQCHHRGVKVFVAYNPWDTGTRREPVADLEALAELVRALDADGIFLDTLDRGATEFRARLDAVRPGVALEGEIALPLDRVWDHHLSWAQWFSDSQAPGILRNKWFERRHMLHQIQRWNADHTAELHTAWMNGTGMLVWENVFGSWVGWCERDKTLLRIMLPIQRRFADWFSGEHWTPLVPTLHPDVYASLWEQGDARLWTLVNRSRQTVAGPLLALPSSPSSPPGERFDLVRGRPLTRPRTRALDDGPAAALAGSIPPRGLGCFLEASPARLGADFDEFLDRQRAIARQANHQTSPVHLTTQPLLGPPSPRVTAAPSGMVAIPAATVVLKTVFRIRECGFYESSPPNPVIWQRLHRRHEIERTVRLGPFALDRTPVTNEQFAAFLAATAYRPPQPENFLKHWAQGAPPPGQMDHPVVYVDLADARAYARWAGKRLPADEEWQFAAQGTDGRLYPWGNEPPDERCNTGATGTTTSVTAFPSGQSPFGCYDLCGNVWEWTESERRDGATRFCLLRGGSFYRARGSDWYMDGGPQPCVFAAKFLRHWPGLDRCATLGFRCAVDLA